MSPFNTSNPEMQCLSAPVIVVGGDFFELRVFQNQGVAVDVLSAESWFSMEIIE